MSYETKWTLVQHSGFGYAGKEQFEMAVETRGVYSKAEENMVRKAGGIIFDDYKEASEAEEKVNGIDGNNPFQCAGTFSNTELDELAIYIPKVSVS